MAVAAYTPWPHFGLILPDRAVVEDGEAQVVADQILPACLQSGQLASTGVSRHVSPLYLLSVEQDGISCIHLGANQKMKYN